MAFVVSGTPLVGSPTGRRGDPRVSLPMVVEIDGARFAAADCSLGGFGLVDQGPVAATGDVLECRLILDLTGLDAVLSVRSEVVRVDGRRALGFRFRNLSAEQAEMLGRAIDHWLSLGSTGSVTSIADARRAEPYRPDHPMPRRRSALVLAGYGAVVLASLAVVAISASSLYGALATVTSDRAAVVSDRTAVRAPVAGFGDRLSVAEGEFVAAGTALFVIAPPVDPRTLGALEREILTIEERLGARERALADAEAAFDAWRDRVEVGLAAATRRVDAASAEVAVRRALFARLAGLGERGLVATVRVDEAEVALRAAERELVVAEEALAAHALDRRLAGAGLYMDEARASRRTPSELRREIAETEAALDRAWLALDDHGRGVVVRSPCDCIVERLSLAPGEYVERGQTALLLTERAGAAAIEVDAFVPARRAGLLREGMTARVALADRDAEMTGRITSIRFVSEYRGRVGLPEDRGGLGERAVVTIALLDAWPRPPVGVPARVGIEIPVGVFFANVMGVRLSSIGAGSG